MPGDQIDEQAVTGSGVPADPGLEIIADDENLFAFCVVTKRIHPGAWRGRMRIMTGILLGGFGLTLLCLIVFWRGGLVGPRVLLAIGALFLCEFVTAGMGVRRFTLRETVEVRGDRVLYIARSKLRTVTRELRGPGIRISREPVMGRYLDTAGYELRLAAGDGMAVSFGWDLDTATQLWLMPRIAGRLEGELARDCVLGKWGAPESLAVQDMPDGGFRIELPRIRFDWMTISTRVLMVGLTAGMINASLSPWRVSAANLMLIGGLVLAGMALWAVPRAFLIQHYVELHPRSLVLRTSFGLLRDRITEIPLNSVREVLLTSRDRSKDRALHILAVRTSEGEQTLGRGLNSEQSNWLGQKIEESRNRLVNRIT